MPKSRDQGVSVTAKALRVLEVFSKEHSALTLSEISRRADLPLATAHRMAGELAGWGALERDDGGRYHIGLRLWEIGSLAPRGAGLRETAMPFLEDLYEATHENVQLAVLDGTEAVYVERISGRGAVSVISRVGGRLPLHATGVGLVLLAHSDPDLQEQVITGPLRRYTEKTITSPQTLRRVLAEVRRARVAISDRQIELHAISVAAPVYGSSDTVVAALSIVVPATQSATALVPAVRAAARGLSRALGSARALQSPTTSRRE